LSQTINFDTLTFTQIRELRAFNFIIDIDKIQRKGARQLYCHSFEPLKQDRPINDKKVYQGQKPFMHQQTLIRSLRRYTLQSSWSERLIFQTYGRIYVKHRKFNSHLTFA
jgi:hypothetical protein